MPWTTSNSGPSFTFANPLQRMWLLGSGRDSDPSCGGWHCSDLPQWVYAKDAHREEKCGRQSGWEQSDSWILSLGVVTAVESELRFFKERSRTVSLLQRKQVSSSTTMFV